MSGPQSICILRLSAIGDVTHVLPVIHYLQQSHPETDITWIIGKLEHQLVAGLPGVEFIVFDKSRGILAYKALRQQLKNRQFDILLHMQVALRGNLASMLVSAREKIGYDRSRSRDLHGLFVNQRIPTQANQHVLDTLGSFLLPLNIDLSSQPPVWNIPLTDQDRQFAIEHIEPTRPTLVISPVSSHLQRNWLPDRYAAVADYAIDQLGFQVILSGSPSAFETRFSRKISEYMKFPALNLVGKDTLKQSAALLGQADLVLAPDTGPVHIANAMGTTVIGLHAASNPRRSGAYNAQAWAVDYYDAAARKFRGKPANALSWGTKIECPGAMALIPVSAVVEKLDQWVKQKSPNPGNAESHATPGNIEK